MRENAGKYGKCPEKKPGKTRENPKKYGKIKKIDWTQDKYSA